MSTTAEVKKVIEIEKPLTGWELQRVFIGMQQLIERVPTLLSKELENAGECGIQDVISRVSSVLDSVKAFEETLDRKASEIYERFEGFYAKVKDANEQTRRRIEALPALPNFSVPYDCKALIEIAERFSHLDDGQWGKVIELAKALQKKPV